MPMFGEQCLQPQRATLHPSISLPSASASLPLTSLPLQRVGHPLKTTAPFLVRAMLRFTAPLPLPSLLHSSRHTGLLL